MRFLVIALAATLSGSPAAAWLAHAAKTATADYSAKKKTKRNTATETVKKEKKPKIEYMRAVPYK